jgi:hypothetical protein
MALSLHAEYLLGYLAGAKGLAPRDVVPFTRIDPSDASAQTRALVKSLALGVSDARRNNPLRDATDVRARVLAMMSTESGARPATASSPPGTDVSAALDGHRTSDPDMRLEQAIEHAVETA